MMGMPIYALIIGALILYLVLTGKARAVLAAATSKKG